MSVSPAIKLSSPGTKEFWEIEVLHEDEHLMAINKPGGLLTSPDRYDAERPNLMKLLHAGIEQGKPWARERGLSYLMNAHRLDFETSGVLLLARNKPVLVELVNLFGSEKPLKEYVALVHGAPEQNQFEVDAPLAPHTFKPGIMRVDPRHGKKSRTQFELVEAFRRFSLLKCRPLTGRTHQIRVHLRHVKLPIVGDRAYGGRMLMLSTLKRDYRLKPNKEERPLVQSLALHAERLELNHPVTQKPLRVEAPWPKDLTVAVKYLRRYAPAGVQPTQENESDAEEQLNSQAT